MDAPRKQTTGLDDEVGRSRQRLAAHARHRHPPASTFSTSRRLFQP